MLEVCLTLIADSSFLVAGVFFGAILCIFLLRRIRVPSTIYGRVVYVCDGDTIHVRSFWKGKFKVRVAFIDAPESEQDDGPESQQWLEKRLLKRRVKLVIRDMDFYGRYVAQIFVGDMDIGLELLRAGWAWAYWPYLKKADGEIVTAYSAAASDARTNRRGMWKRRDLIKPWNWRRQHRSFWSRCLFFFRRIWRRMRLAYK